MSPCASAIYDILRVRVPTTGDPRIAYGDLNASLRQLGSRSVALASGEGIFELRKTLEEIVEACRARQLPCIIALIVQQTCGQLGYPGGGYYSYVHPDAKSKEEKLVLWGRELEAVKRTTYPEQI